ncbi:MAG: GNAT family N-acetyltransferase, partial [Jiangellaceae bacterium]
MHPDAGLAPLTVRAQAPAVLPDLPGDVGLIWRALTPDDVPAWYTLTTITQTHDDAIERTSEHELTEQF